MREFLLDKFEFDLASNIKWCRLIEENNELVPDKVLKWMSHIINAHHIWVRRIAQKPIESGLWDEFQEYNFIALHRENFNETKELLETFPENEKIVYPARFHNKFNANFYDVLYHILNHNNYHRAQISMEFKEINIASVETNYITYKREF